MKPDFPTRFFWWSHQLPDRFENRSDFLIVLSDAPLEFRKFPCKFAICVERLSEPHKRTHKRDIYLHSALAVQYAR
jgi:hypothetical protein